MNSITQYIYSNNLNDSMKQLNIQQNVISQDTILADSSNVMIKDSLICNIISGIIAMLVVCI